MSEVKELKPFCVDAEFENLTADQRSLVYNWCIEAQSLLNIGGAHNECESYFHNDCYPYIGLDEDLDTHAGHYTVYSLDNIIQFSEVRAHLGLPPLEDNVTEQLQAVEDDIVPTVKDVPKEPFDPRNLLSDTILDIAYSKEGITVTVSTMDMQFMVNTNEELLMLCDLLNKVDSFKVV